MPRIPARAVVALLILCAVLLALLWPTSGTPALPPCPTEDSVSCSWDAQQQGNGIGRSFTVDAHGTVTYID